jgi:amino acid ABC transporter substrate-binding protein
MKKTIAMLLAAVLCTASLTACGSGSDTKSESSAAQSSAAQSSAAEGTAASNGEAQTLVVGTNAEFPPFEYLGDDGEPEGFDIALIKAIGEKLGMNVEVQNMEFDSLVAAIGSKIDVAIAGMTIDEERQKTVDFSDPYYDAVQYVIVSADSDMAAKGADAAMADLEGLTIGCQLGTTGNFIIEDDIANATAQTYNKAVDAVNDLINGKIDAVIIDKNPAEVFADKFAGQVVAIDGNQFGFSIEQYAIALPKNSELKDQINQALADLKADGTFDALVSEYIGSAE